MKRYQVSSICNALMDILIHAEDKDIQELGLTKGIMHLVDADRQKEVLNHFDHIESTTELGGSALNCVRALAALDQETVFAGVVCQHDEFGQAIEARMTDLGIKARLGHVDEPTGTCLILVTPDGQRTMNTCLGASRLYTQKVVPHDDIANSKIFHFCGYQWDTDDQKEAILKAIDTAKANNVLVSFDVADPFVVQRNKSDFLELIQSSADIVFTNEEETKLLFDCSPEEAAQKIADWNAVAFVKLGAKGALLKRGDEMCSITPEKTTVVDTTAAGDMFAGGALYGLLNHKSLEECGRMGSILAGDVISRMGARLSDSAINKLKSL